MKKARRHASRVAVLAALVLAAAGAAGAGDEMVRVGDRPAPVYLWRNTQSEVLTRVQPGARLSVWERNGDWVWVQLPPDEYGARLAGWIDRRMLADPEEKVRVGDRPAPVYLRRTSQSEILGTVRPGTQLPVWDRTGDWVWVQLPPDGYGARLVGWIDRRMLANAEVPATKSDRDSSSEPLRGATPAVLSGPSASEPGAAATAATPAPPPPSASERRVAATASAPPAPSSAPPAAARPPAVPPPPIGSAAVQAAGGMGDWFVARGLRASVGANYQSATVSQTAGSLDDRLLGGGATLTAGFAILDPRILSVDFAGDFQASRATSDSSLASFRNATGLQSYRADVGVLSGRRAPLRVYAERVSSTSDLEPFGATLDPLRRTRGVRRGAGFSWDVDLDPALPHVWISASTARQLDERNYLFGYSSTDDERRAEVRANRDYKRARYDLHYTHGAFVYDVPAAGVRSDTASDVLLLTGRVTPTDRLSVDLHARGSRFRFGAGSDMSSVTGIGGDGGLRYQLSRAFAASGRYSFSNNAAEAALSGRVAPGQPGAEPVTSRSDLAARTLFHDGEARLEYSTRPVTAAAVLKDVSFDVPSSQPSTLTALRTGGLRFRAQRTFAGLTIGGGADGAVGTARSNHGLVQPYREAGIEALLSRDAGRSVRFGLDASTRRVARLSFFPVNLESTAASLRFETLRPGWARLRLAVTRVDSLRDIMLSDARDRHFGYSVGLSGRWYDITADINQADTRSVLLAPEVFGSRPDVAMLIATRPELFRNLLASSDRAQVYGVQLRPVSGLQIQGRLRRQQQLYPDFFATTLNGGQASASYQVRELQIEIGWEYFDSWTSFGQVRDRRVYVRVRRDVVFF